MTCYIFEAERFASLPDFPVFHSTLDTHELNRRIIAVAYILFIQVETQIRLLCVSSLLYYIYLVSCALKPSA